MTAVELEFASWSPEHLDDAAHLLAARHKLHRQSNLALPELDQDGARQLLLETAAGTRGFVACRAGELVGYLRYTPITEGHRAGFAWSDLNDHAATDAETTRSLYAHAAKHWVHAGLRQHVVHAPAVHDLLWPWFVTSFGIQHTWALRDTAPLHRHPSSDDIVMRRIGPDEAATAGLADLVLTEHLRGSPAFSPMPTPSVREAVREQREFLEEPSVCALVAELDGKHLGYGEITDDRKRDLRAPSGGAIFGIVVVAESARGQGVGRSLTSALLDWAREQGFDHAICDWAATNLESSRAFMSFGWTPTFYRLYRVLPEPV
ncbi:MAG: GNAT family N-acetyltransferase [Nocardioidaceae bacterium]